VIEDQRASTVGGRQGRDSSGGVREPRTLGEYWARVRQWHRYNATLHVGEGISSFFGLTCFAPETVLATYVGLMTSSKFLIALPWALFIFSWAFPQLFFAYFLQRARQRRSLAVWANAVNRIPMWLIAVSALLVPRFGARFALVSLLALMSVNVIFAGLGFITWQGLLGRIIAPEKRGRFFGIKQSTGMVAACASAYVVARLLEWSGKDNPQSYALPFFIGITTFSFSVFLLSRSKEPFYPRQREPVQGWWRYTRGVLALVRQDRNFARYLLIRVLLPCACLFPLSLYTAYAAEVFSKGGPEIIKVLTPMVYVGQIVFSPFAGRIGDRFGFKTLLVIAAGALAASFSVGLTLTLWGDRVMVGFALVYFLFGIGWAAMTIGNMNIVFEFAHVEDRPAYMGLSATVGAPTMLLVPAFGGWLVDQMGYVPVMWASLVMALVVGVVAAFGFREPRNEHHDLESLGLTRS